MWIRASRQHSAVLTVRRIAILAVVQLAGCAEVLMSALAGETAVSVVTYPTVQADRRCLLALVNVYVAVRPLPSRGTCAVK